MTREQIAAAWREQEIPAALPQAEHLPWRMLRAVYHGYRDGTIPREEAEMIKGNLLRYDALGAPEQITLLQYVFDNLRDRAAQGDAAAIADSKAVAAAFHRHTGRAPLDGPSKRPKRYF